MAYPVWPAEDSHSYSAAQIRALWYLPPLGAHVDADRAPIATEQITLFNLEDRMTRELIRIHDELNAKFADGSVFDASEEDFERFLRGLCTTPVSNERIRHQEINRCHVINTIRTFRFLKTLEESNKQFVRTIDRSNRQLTTLAMVLTLLMALLAGWSIWLSYASSRATQRIVDIQLRQLEVLEGYGRTP